VTTSYDEVGLTQTHPTRGVSTSNLNPLFQHPAQYRSKTLFGLARDIAGRGSVESIVDTIHGLGTG